MFLRLHDHQDLHRRPVALGGARPDDVRRPRVAAAEPLHRLSSAAQQRRDGQHRRHRRHERRSGGVQRIGVEPEIAGPLCAASIAQANGDTADAATYQSIAQSWAAEVDSLTYTTNGPYGSGRYYLRITPDGQPNAGTSIGIANGGGSHDDRTVVDPSFLELVRLGVKSPSAADITNSISVADSQIQVSTPEGPIWHRYNFDGYGETASGGDYTGSGVGNPWPVLSGERGEYDIAAGNLSGAQSMLQTMAGAANSGYQIPEQVWAGTTGTGGFTFGQPDNSSTPLMWAMAQYARLAIDISAGSNVDSPAVVGNCLQKSSCPVSGSVKETVNVTVPVSTDASGDTVYLDGNLSALGLGQPDWAANGIPVPSGTPSGDTVYLPGNYDVLGTGIPAADDWVAADYPMTQTGTASDTVAAWAGVGSC